MCAITGQQLQALCVQYTMAHLRTTGFPTQMQEKMKIVMAPVNLSGQPITLINKLKQMGIDATLLQYSTNDTGHKFGYEADQLINIKNKVKSTIQLETLKKCLQDDVNIFHFWLRSLFFQQPYEKLMGFDIPLIKHYGRKVVYRFTGQDCRIKSAHIQKNPYQAYQYGYENVFDEAPQQRYLDFLREYVDQFVVQDPEMQSYFPQATIIPRSIDLEGYHYKTLENHAIPLIIHAPSNPIIKGTSFIEKALTELKREGLKFNFKLISDMQHQEALTYYQQADLVIDQMHIGWYGVFALECMALGKPVICYIQDEFYQTFKQQQPGFPIVNANLDTLKQTIKDFVMDYDRRKEYGDAGRQFIESYHDVNVVAPQLVQLYDRVLRAPSVAPRAYADIDYYIDQFSRLQCGPSDRSKHSLRWKQLKQQWRSTQNMPRHKAVLHMVKVIRNKLIPFRLLPMTLRVLAKKWRSTQGQAWHQRLAFFSKIVLYKLVPFKKK